MDILTKMARALILSSVIWSLLCLPQEYQQSGKDVNYRTGEEYYYEPSYKDYSDKYRADTAVVVVGYNRPHYFKEVLASLEANPESQTLPFFFFIDGGPKAKQERYKELIKKSSIARKYVVQRPLNYGLHWNIISGLRFIFDWCGFKRIIHFEDDVVVTPQYLGLMIKLDTWAHNTYDNIAAVQGFRPCKLSREEKTVNLDVVGETAGLWLGYCLRKNVWDVIKPMLYEYETLFLQGREWNGQLVKKIKKWMKNKLAAGHRVEQVASRRQWSIPLDPYYSKLPEMGLGQCGIMTMSVFLNNYVRLTTLVNRAINIGVKGTNYRESLWKSHFAEVTLDEFDVDTYLKVFRPHATFLY